jgi:hypothetical protein
MNPVYEITISIKTPAGLTQIGSLSLGAGKQFALSTFDSLKGETGDTQDAPIRLCLVEKTGQTSARQLKCIGCILNEYAANAKLIVRDVFKVHNLGQ